MWLFRNGRPGARPPGRPRLADTAQLGDFLDSQAAFIAQKCVVEYCRARAGLLSRPLFEERAFLDALEVGRWEAFAAVLGDLVLLVEGRLRRLAGSGAGAAPWLPGSLVALAMARLGAHPPPRHRPDGWAGEAGILADRLERARREPPLPAHRIALGSAPRVFGALPIHPRLRAPDAELVTNNLRINLCGAAEQLDRRAELPALLADLGRRRPAAARPA